MGATTKWKPSNGSWDLRLRRLVDPGMRATDHQHKSIRRVDGKRQFLELPGARSIRDKSDQSDAPGDFGCLVDELEVGALPGRTEAHYLGWFAVEIAHVRRQGFGLAIEARRQRRAEDAEALLGRVDLHLGINAQHMGQPRHVVPMPMRQNDEI